MKKRAYIIIAVIAILSLSITAGALFFSGTPTAKKYTSEDSKAYIVLKEDSTFEFNYSLLSSTIPTGKYKIIGRQVHCYDNSEYELKYVFDVKGDTLSFNALLSSKLPAFSEVKNGDFSQCSSDLCNGKMRKMEAQIPFMESAPSVF